MVIEGIKIPPHLVKPRTVPRKNSLKIARQWNEIRQRIVGQRQGIDGSRLEEVNK
jgi:hypothetical protein